MTYTSPDLGFEATYRFSTQMGWMQDIIDREDDSILYILMNSDSLARHMDTARISLFNFEDGVVDDANIEVSTHVITPKERKRLIAQFDRMNKVLSKFQLVPSIISHNCNMEGGGHIHLGYAQHAKEYTKLHQLPSDGMYPGYYGKKHYYHFIGKMLKNLNDIANTYPALLWAMNSPYDAINAKSTLWNPKFDNGINELCRCTSRSPFIQTDYDLGRKSFGIIYRQFYETFEFRFFTMPKDGDALNLNISVAENMYKKAFELTIADKTIKPTYTDKKQLCQITKNEAVNNLKKAAKYLGIDYGDFVKNDRVKSLRKRFQLEAIHNPSGNINETYLN